MIAVLASCAERNGAAGVRIEGAARIAAVRAAVALPIIGIVKHVPSADRPYITTSVADVGAIIGAGAQIVAFDATDRERPGGVSMTELVGAIHSAGALAMADCASFADAVNAAARGVEIVATTLAGYTEQTRGTGLPALDLLAELARMHPFAICEGGIGHLDDVRAAFARGAAAVVVGTAITNVDARVRHFAAGARRT